MNYYYHKAVLGSFDNVIERTKALFKEAGFGILTEIDMQETLNKKLDVNFKKYTILGAFNPSLAYKALNTEDKIGTLLPCNVIVQELEDDLVEVAVVNPLESMQAVINKDLIKIAQNVSHTLEDIIHNL